MKRKMLMFRNQLLILGFGSLMIVSCSKDDLNDFFGVKNKTEDQTNGNNGSDSCLTCGNNTDTTNTNGGGTDTTENHHHHCIIQDSTNIDSTYTNGGNGGNGGGTDSTNGGGYIYFDSIYNNPNYDPNNGVLLGH